MFAGQGIGDGQEREGTGLVALYKCCGNLRWCCESEGVGRSLGTAGFLGIWGGEPLCRLSDRA